ncbi:MAG: cyclohexanecarboxylate-CoA ligase [SAR324 cluster bacterium]|nr:cyclohexanecarboxylate-CoA ligase [SAR324 cluster bacterium]
MIFDPILSPERIAAARRAGSWHDRLITDYLDDAVRSAPDRVAIVDRSGNGGESVTLSYRSLARQVNRIAAGLVSLGVRQNDVVAYQLPNCWQFTALSLACVRIGAVANPLMPIFRHRELAFMLSHAEAKVVVVPRRFRGFDYPAMMAELREQLPALEHVLVVGGDGAQAFEARLLREETDGSADAGDEDPGQGFAARRPGPNDVTELQYTSGTTGEPKGVMHTANTLVGTILPFIGRLGLGSRDVVLMASPMAHQTGFLYGLMMPIMLGAKAVLQDVWSAERALSLIQEQRVTFTMAATPFLADLTESPALGSYDLASLRIFLTAGAPIPRVLVRQATERLRVHVVSAWGMTENGAVTTTKLDDPPEKTFATDGCCLAGMAVRVVDDGGRPLPPGGEGRLQVRGAFNFVGYLKRPQAYAVDAGGWFETGDRARMDEQGYIRITGRDKDIIIRGGENVPVVEVEQMLYRHPAIQDAAIVAMPDERLVERACAYVVPREGQTLTFGELIAYLAGQRMAKQYLPERLVLIEEMPRTPSGKIQKFRLREMARNLGPA